MAAAIEIRPGKDVRPVSSRIYSLSRWRERAGVRVLSLSRFRERAGVRVHRGRPL